MIKNLLWQRSAGHWLFWTSFLYIVACVINIEFNHFADIVAVQLVWLLVLSLPLFIPQLATYLNMRTLWGTVQDKKEIPVPDNVVEFPQPKVVPPVTPPKPAGREYYRVGFVEPDEMVTLTVLGDGSSMTLSMNHGACEQLIRMLRAAFPEEDYSNPTED